MIYIKISSNCNNEDDDHIKYSFSSQQYIIDIFDSSENDL